MQADPDNLEALLDVGVSFTNELIPAEVCALLKHNLLLLLSRVSLSAHPFGTLTFCHEKALSYLKSWLHHHPEYRELIREEEERETSELGGFLTLHERITRMFERAMDISPHDPDLHTVLGVLYNLSRGFEKVCYLKVENSSRLPRIQYWRLIRTCCFCF